MLLGGSSATVGSTDALFFSNDDASGTLQIDSEPTLAYQVNDESLSWGVRYVIQYNVEWAPTFDRIEIQVENLDNGSIGETLSSSSQEGSLTYPSGSYVDGGDQGDTYRFTFRVYDAANALLISPAPQDTDVAGGGGTGDGDMGSTDDPTLETFDVTDDSSGITARYTVDYQISNATASNFSEVAVTFDDTDVSFLPPTTETSSQTSDSISYSQQWTEGDNYEITIEVRNENGVMVDSDTVSDVADGIDP